MTKKCVGPECSADQAVGDLCLSHYQQKRRHPDAPLRPLRGDARPMIRNVRVAPVTLDRLEREAKRLGIPIATLATIGLDSWMSRPRK